MQLSWKWLSPLLLRLLSLSSQTGLASASTLSNFGSVHLVTGFYVGIAASASDNLQPRVRPHLSLDGSTGTTFIELGRQELVLPIMPLHLLGKKSWNVYNQTNIDKVRRDEAIAAAAEAAEEERQQEVDATRRLAILRGETPPPIPLALDAARSSSSQRQSHPHSAPRERKVRKRSGEDDTDFEVRQAQALTTLSSNAESQIVLRRPAINDAPLIDEAGHIDLFPQEKPTVPIAKPGSFSDIKRDREAEDVAKRKKDYERDYTVKFSDAAGYKQGLERPWYSKDGAVSKEDDEVPNKDVWGNADPRRKDREAARITSNDPLAMMKQGAARVRQVEKERKRWREERQKEMAGLDEAKDERRKRRRKEGDVSDDELEGFSLSKDERSSRHEKKKARHGESRHREHRHRNRDGDRDKDRESDSHRRRHRH